jgi:hypothetical protein
VFIRVVVDYYKRLGLTPTDAELVNRIKRQMHPEYVQALQGKVIVSLRDLMDAAFDAQDLIKSYRAYRPPPLVPGVEPSLQWRPLDYTNFHQPRNEVQTFTSLPDRANARLHPHAIDEYTYFHADRSTQNNQQQIQRRNSGFGENTNQPDRQVNEARPLNQNQASSSRPNNDFIPRSSSPNPSQVRPTTPTNNARPTTPNNLNNRRCFTCNAPDHLSPSCPLSRNSPRASGNGQPPSPSRK